MKFGKKIHQSTTLLMHLLYFRCTLLRFSTTCRLTLELFRSRRLVSQCQAGTVRDLGVILDNRFTMADQVAAVSFYQLRQIRSVARSLSAKGNKAMLHDFISCRLDYCNSLLTEISDGLLRRLQSVQNAAVRLVTDTRRCKHISPVASQSINQSINQSLHKIVIRDRQKQIQRDATNTSRRYLRSATHGDLQVPRTRTDHEVLLFQVLLSGTLCHRPYVYRPLHLESFRVD